MVEFILTHNVFIYTVTRKGTGLTILNSSMRSQRKHVLVVFRSNAGNVSCYDEGCSDLHRAYKTKKHTPVQEGSGSHSGYADPGSK